jgi:TatD DNase family protein
LLINIHSHSPEQKGEWVIQNKYAGFDSITTPGNYSVGLHPWYINEATWQPAFLELQQAANTTAVKAIGECGLDKICTTPFYLQESVFAAHIRLANAIGKPLIIHCVQAYEEVLALLVKQAVKVPVIFHGFNKKLPLAKRIIKAGYYVSFGKALLQPRMQQVFAALPLQHCFLETDDAGISIDEVYTWAAAGADIAKDLLSLQIKKNAIAVFGSLTQ